MATSTSAREAEPQLLLKAPSSSAQMCAFHPHVQNLLKQNVCVCVCLRARMGPYMPRRWVWFVCAWYSHLLGCASWCLRRFAGFPVSTKWWKLIEIFVDSNSLPSFKQIWMSSYTCVLKSLTANAKYLWDFPCKMSLLPPNMTKKKKRKMRRFVFSQDRAVWRFVSRSEWKASNFCCSKWQQTTRNDGWNALKSAESLTDG